MLRALVVDDNRSARALVTSTLEREGIDVIAMADGPAALKAFDTAIVDVVVLDIFMPGMDGLETLSALRARSRDVPVIVMSRHHVDATHEPPPDYAAMAIKLGAQRALYKPFSPRELIRAVKACLGGSLRSRRPFAAAE
jgi:two-component system response regulator RegX3